MPRMSSDAPAVRNVLIRTHSVTESPTAWTPATKRSNYAVRSSITSLVTYQNLRSRFGIERYAYTESHIGQIPCVCMCVCMYVCM